MQFQRKHIPYIAGGAAVAAVGLSLLWPNVSRTQTPIPPGLDGIVTTSLRTTTVRAGAVTLTGMFPIHTSERSIQKLCEYFDQTISEKGVAQSLKNEIQKRGLQITLVAPKDWNEPLGRLCRVVGGNQVEVDAREFLNLYEPNVARVDGKPISEEARIANVVQALFPQIYFEVQKAHIGQEGKLHGVSDPNGSSKARAAALTTFFVTSLELSGAEVPILATDTAREDYTRLTAGVPEYLKASSLLPGDYYSFVRKGNAGLLQNISEKRPGTSKTTEAIFGQYLNRMLEDRGQDLADLLERDLKNRLIDRVPTFSSIPFEYIKGRLSWLSAYQDLTDSKSHLHHKSELADELTYLTSEWLKAYKNKEKEITKKHDRSTFFLTSLADPRMHGIAAISNLLNLLSTLPLDSVTKTKISKEVQEPAIKMARATLQEWDHFDSKSKQNAVAEINDEVNDLLSAVRNLKKFAAGPDLVELDGKLQRAHKEISTLLDAGNKRVQQAIQVLPGFADYPSVEGNLFLVAEENLLALIKSHEFRMLPHALQRYTVMTSLAENSPNVGYAFGGYQKLRLNPSERILFLGALSHLSPHLQNRAVSLLNDSAGSRGFQELGVSVSLTIFENAIDSGLFRGTLDSSGCLEDALLQAAVEYKIDRRDAIKLGRRLHANITCDLRLPSNCRIFMSCRDSQLSWERFPRAPHSFLASFIDGLPGSERAFENAQRTISQNPVVLSEIDAFRMNSAQIEFFRKRNALYYSPIKRGTYWQEPVRVGARLPDMKYTAALFIAGQESPWEEKKRFQNELKNARNSFKARTGIAATSIAPTTDEELKHQFNSFLNAPADSRGEVIVVLDAHGDYFLRNVQYGSRADRLLTEQFRVHLGDGCILYEGDIRRQILEPLSRKFKQVTLVIESCHSGAALR